VQFLLSRPDTAANRIRVAKVMGRVEPACRASPEGQVFSCENEEKTRSLPSEIFKHGRAGYTVLMWTVVLLIGVVNYILFSWLAVLFEQAGVDLTKAVLAATAFPFGSMVSSLWLSGRLRSSRAPLLLAGFAALYAIALVAMGHLTFSFPLLVVAVFLAGVGSGPQGVTHALNAAIYPTLLRSTGIGWSSSIGRVGGAIGPLIGGGLIALGWTTAQILTASAVPIIGVIGAFLAMFFVRSTRLLMNSRLAIST
jgi:AAHS family 4-hydroxybenzoate transporter-like MFS transporter